MMKKVIALLRYSVIALIMIGPAYCLAQDDNRAITLADKIMKAESSEDIYEYITELTNTYFKDNKYNECIEQLKSLLEQKKGIEPVINYFIALSQYNQLRYWEDSQEWNEYFNKGSLYRSQIEALLEDAINKTTVKNPVNIYAKLLLWKFYNNQGNNLADKLLSNIKNSVLDYSKETTDIILIKNIADSLLSTGEKIQSKELYKIYVDKLVAASSQVKELEPVALGFYKEGNLELSEALYDTYIERSLTATPKEEFYPVLISIAEQFSYKALPYNVQEGLLSPLDKSQGVKDIAYAEKIFNKLEQLAGKDIFNEELLYLRAVNLEEIKDYAKAKDVYIDLISRYPGNRYSEEANYKIAVIYIYVLADVDKGAGYLEKLSQSTIATPEVIPSLYQLGLLKQWSNDFLKAKEYYNRLLELAKNGFVEKVKLTKERLTEINDEAPIEYNLKTFMDVSLKKENRISNISGADLKVMPYEVKKNEKISVCSNIYSLETGCMQVDLDYLWSGDLGDALVRTNNSGFDTKYADKGAKLICLVVVSPSGVVSRGIEIVNVSE